MKKLFLFSFIVIFAISTSVIIFSACQKEKDNIIVDQQKNGEQKANLDVQSELILVNTSKNNGALKSAGTSESYNTTLQYIKRCVTFPADGTTAYVDIYNGSGVSSTITVGYDNYCSYPGNWLITTGSAPKGYIKRISVARSSLGSANTFIVQITANTSIGSGSITAYTK